MAIGHDIVPSAHVPHSRGGTGQSESGPHSGQTPGTGTHSPLTHSTEVQASEPSGHWSQATSKIPQSFAEKHSGEQLGNAPPHTPFASQYCAMGSQGAFGGHVLHGAPHSLPAHGSKPPPETPPVGVPPPETPPLGKPPFAEPPLDAPPFPVSPASPAAGSSSPWVNVDCPPHAPAQRNTAPSATT